MALFPSTYIHIGGDELPKDRWKACPKCQKRILDNHLKDEHELQSYFVQRIEKYLNAKGRKIIGWDEILEGGLAANATVMSWRGEQGGIDAANQHHQVIMTPGSYVYFDHAQETRIRLPSEATCHYKLYIITNLYPSNWSAMRKAMSEAHRPTFGLNTSAMKPRLNTCFSPSSTECPQ